MKPRLAGVHSLQLLMKLGNCRLGDWMVIVCNLELAEGDGGSVSAKVPM